MQHIIYNDDELKINFIDGVCHIYFKESGREYNFKLKSEQHIDHTGRCYKWTEEDRDRPIISTTNQFFTFNDTIELFRRLQSRATLHTY